MSPDLHQKVLVQDCSLVLQLAIFVDDLHQFDAADGLDGAVLVVSSLFMTVIR
jgi:hypothetical protein